MKKFLCSIILITALITVQNADAVVMDFEDLPLSATYSVGEEFVSSGVTVSVSDFYPVGDEPMSGNVAVDDLGMAGGIQNELHISGADLNFLFGFSDCPSCGIVLIFSNYGGDINLGINDDLRSVSNVAGLPSIIGGATVRVVGGNIGAMLVINGQPINTFTFGGENVYIDTALTCELEAVPEPATITLLGMGAFSVLAGRKRRNKQMNGKTG